MKTIFWVWIWFAGFVIVGEPLYAQCGTILSDYRQLIVVKNGKPEQLVSQAINLQKKWQQCSQTQDSTLIRLILFTGDLFLVQENYQSAAEQYEKGVKISTEKKQEDLLSQSTYLLGCAYLKSNQIERAKVCFKAVLKKIDSRSSANRWGALSQLNLAYLSFLQGDYQEALVHADAGKDWALSLHDGALVAKLLREKVNVFYELGQFEEAATTAHEMILKAKTANEQNMGQYYLALGDIESACGKFDQAVKAYSASIAYYGLTKNINQQAYALTNIGFLYYSQGKYKESIEYYQKALVLQKNPFSQARLFDNLAACWWKMGQFEKALSTYQQGLTVMPIDFRASIVTKNPSSQTIRFVRQKEYLLTLIQDKADTWLDYAKATGNDRNRLKAALATYNVADQMIDFMRWEHTGQQSKLFWRQKTRGMYERAIETCYRLGNAEQAFRFMEKSRSVMLADKINELGARQQLTKEQIAEEQALQQSVSRQQEKLADLSPDNSATYNVARMALFAKQDSLNDFLKKLETTNPAYYQYKYDNKTTSLADLQQYLKKQASSLVTYFVGDSALYVMSVTGNKTSLTKQPVGAYNQSLRQFSKRLSDPVSMQKREDVNRFLTLSHDLYQQLLAPLNLPKGRVVVSPDGFFVPFDALSRSANQPDYAVADYAFSYVYSVGLLLKSNGSRGVVPSLNPVDFLGVAPVEFASSLKQVVLPRSDAALEPIASRFKVSTLLTHGDATREAFLEKADNARIIHLFTHATADSTDSEPSLYFTDSALQLSYLSDQALPNAQMVVLAACKTGIGADQRGEGVFSLARGFAALGVPSVLTTLWSVQNEATYELTDLFYQYLDQGLPKDIALQRAKTDWLKNAEGAGALPNYWAGLIIVGDPKPLLHLSYSPWVAILFLLAIIGVGGYGFWQKRERRARPQLSSAHSA